MEAIHEGFHQMKLRAIVGRSPRPTPEEFRHHGMELETNAAVGSSGKSDELAVQRRRGGHRVQLGVEVAHQELVKDLVERHNAT